MHLQMSLLSLPEKKNNKQECLIIKVRKVRISTLASLCLLKTLIQTRNRFRVLAVVHSTTGITTLEASLCVCRYSTLNPSPIVAFSNVIGGHCNTTGTQLLPVTLNGTDVCIKLRIPRVIQSSCCATHQLTRL